MTERPILFSAPMVKEILEGRKTMTRRVVKKDISNQFDTGDSCDTVEICPYGSVGDRLWVKETWAVEESLDAKPPRGFSAWPVWFKANNAYCCNANGFPNHGFHSPNATKGKWRPSIFMPRWASRITLEITGISVERLQDITEEDAMKEGIPMEIDCPECDTARKKFKNLWDSINGKKPGKAWNANPWVWVVEFRREGC